MKKTSPQNALLKHVALTGASGSLGRGLALALARPGLRISLAGRNRERLSALARDLTARGVQAETASFNIRDRSELESWLRGADAAEPLDLVWANAGVTAGPEEEHLEDPDDLDRILEINAQATIRTAALAAELMRPRGRGQIVLTSSLAALWPLPSGPAYGASKAAARLYGRALRAWARPHGLKVTVVCPGYLDTPMSDRLLGPQPLTWPVDRAAAYMIKKLAGNPAEIIFPRLLAWGLRFLPLMPERLAAFFTNRFSYRVRPDAESPRWRGNPQ